MSHIWIIIQQWAIVINLATGQTFLIINTQWVCLSKWHEWWQFEVPRYREELKERYGGVLSFNHYFLSLFEYYGNSLLSLVPERLRQKLAPTPPEVLREAEDDTYEAPGWVTSGEIVIPLLGFQWLWSATFIGLYILTMWANVGFYAALWGGGARGSLAQLMLVATMWENQGRAVGGGKAQFVTTNLLAMIPWQAIVDFFRLSEKVEDDGVVPSEPVSTRSRWSLALRVFYSLVIGLLVYFAYARFDVSMGGVVVIFVALAVGKAVLLWNDDNYKLETALALQQPGPQSLCWRVELKCRGEGGRAEVNQKGKERQTETDVFAFDFVDRHQLEPRPARCWFVALFAVLGAVVGAVLLGRIGFGALAGLVFGFIRFGPKQGVPMVYIADSRFIEWMVRTGVWHLVASANAWKMGVKTVEIQSEEPSKVGNSSEWAKHQGHAIVVVADDGLQLYKCQPLGQRMLNWRSLQPSYELAKVAKDHLERAMALRLVRDGVDQGPLVPARLIRKVPINEFARAAREVIEASNEVATWPRKGPVQIDLRKPHELVTLGEAQMKARSATARTNHQLAVSRVLGLLADGSIDYFRAYLGVALAFVCVAVAAWSCGLVAAGATACACVLALSYVVTGITGASVDMLSECKHSVTVKYWGGPRGWFFRLLFAALVLAVLCGLRGGAELFWLVLLRGLSSLVVALFLGLFGGLVSLPIAVSGSSGALWSMGIETARTQYAEVVVGAFAAAVFVFSRVFECGSVVELLLDDGSWARGRIEKIYKGDEKRATTYDIELLDGGGYVLGVTATLPDGAARMRSTDGKPDFILSVLDTTDPDLNKALRNGFTATNLVHEVFGNVDAGDQTDYWSPGAGRTGRPSELAEELRPKVNRSFCKPDGLSKMLIDKLAAHQNLLEKLCRQSPLELAKPKAPPPGSRVAVRFSDGVDYDGTVEVALDETRATVQFDDGTSDVIRFPDRDVRVTRVGPAPSTGSFVVADDEVEYEGGPNAEVEPVPAVRRSRATAPSYFESDDDEDVAPPPPPPRRSKKRKSDDESDDEPPAKRARQSKKKRGSSGSGDEPASKRRRTDSEPDEDGWDDELPELPPPDDEDGWA